MTARRIARELAVIVLPQLPRDKAKLEKVELGSLVAKAVQMLVDYARQSLADAEALLTRSEQQVLNIELEHPANQDNVETLAPVPLTSDEVRIQLGLVERALHLVNEALDIPDIALQSGYSHTKVVCTKCSYENAHPSERVDSTEVREFLYRLVDTYVQNRVQIDDFIRHAKAKWKIERMVSIDRDILRLACAEAYFLKDIPIRVCINEAVELSHTFADERAAKFINGILGDLACEAEHFRRTGEVPSRAPDTDTTEIPVGTSTEQ
ncbi:MAG: transcription antitermination factor NusB [Candidatus Melainabacteria bacterium]|nr:transcription antitermination factor NusB [Candidatus Melainabacteria bacterium]